MTVEDGKRPGKAIVRANRQKLLGVMSVLLALALTAGLMAGKGSKNGETGPETAAAAVTAEVSALTDGLTPHQLAGQRAVTGFSGTSVPADVKRAIRGGKVGGVILFAENLPNRATARRLTRSLEAIKRPGRLARFPLLIMIDQEGGLVKRLSGAPTVSAEAMGRRGPAFSRNQGKLTARNLRNAGVNVDLAPVLDVARPGGTIDDDDRAFGTTAAKVSRTAVPFAAGLQANGVAATAKHFPGLGSARINTDFAVQRVNLSKAALRRVDEKPYEDFIAAGGELVMVGSAIYTAFGDRPAAFEKSIATRELRGRLGFEGVTITDALETVAVQDFGGSAKVALAGARAGMDLLLYTHLDESLKGEDALAKRLRSGGLDREGFEASVERILRLRAKFR